MTLDLNPYPAYKDSGVPWLGNVPEHWNVLQIGRVGSLFKGNGGNKGDEVPAGVPCVRYGDLYTRYEFFIRSTKAYVSKERAADYTSIRYGDILFAASGETIEDIGRSAVNLIETDACCGGDVLVLRPRIDAVSEFLGYASDSAASRHQKACMGRGFTVVHIYGSQLKRLAFPFPPIPEQTAIVRFLDWADQRIQRVIRVRQRRIKLLEEYKQALIHQAVTGKIDVRTGKSYPKYKDSGVEWLGEVPEHWEVHRLKAIARIRYGLGQPPRETESGVPMLRATNVCRGIIVENDLMHVDPEEVPENRGAFLKAGEIIVVRSGAYTADSAIIPSRFGGAVAGYDMVLTAKLVSPEFLAFVLLTPYVRDNQLIIASMRSAQPHLNAEELGAALIVTPPIEEQNTIVLFLDEQTERIDAAIAADHRVIDLLKEFRTRLIADVVTGKLDVREAAAKLPDQLEESETMDDLDKLLSVEHQDDNNDGNNDHHEKHDDSQ